MDIYRPLVFAFLVCTSAALQVESDGDDFNMQQNMQLLMSKMEQQSKEIESLTKTVRKQGQTIHALKKRDHTKDKELISLRKAINNTVQQNQQCSRICQSVGADNLHTPGKRHE